MYALKHYELYWLLSLSCTVLIPVVENVLKTESIVVNWSMKPLTSKNVSLQLLYYLQILTAEATDNLR